MREALVWNEPRPRSPSPHAGGLQATAARALLVRLRLLSAPAAVVVAAVCWTAARGIDHRFISFSDGVYLYASSAAAANGMHVLYADIPVSLPPGVLLAAAGVWRAAPHVEAVRLVLAALSGLTAVLTYCVGRRLLALARAPAVVAALVALTGPVHAQFVGLDGEAILTPLALAVALCIDRRRFRLLALLLGAGFFFKLTWAPFFLAAVCAVLIKDGRRAAARAAGGGVLIALCLYAVSMIAFSWSVHDLLAQLLFAESRSGLQLQLLPGLAAAVIIVWWPLLMLASVGVRRLDATVLALFTAAALSATAMLKQGTFFNVLDPLEPFLALAAVLGGVTLLRQRQLLPRLALACCSIGVVVHAASVSSSDLSRAIPVPVGAALVNVDNAKTVDRIAATVAAHSSPTQPVLVNPLFALLAGRHEPGDASDWFILYALERSCGGTPDQGRHCNDWPRVKRLAQEQRIAVVSVDVNVASFDKNYRADALPGRGKALLAINLPPIQTRIFGRSARPTR
jgi:hypothetical protein